MRAHLTVCLAATLLALSLPAPAQFHGTYEPPGDEMSPQEHARIMDEIERNRARLVGEGKLSPVPAKALTNFAWPLRQAAGRTDPGYFGIANYVDENPAYPNQTLDYNCGTRTYDLASGYNHQGTDIFISPWSWRKMDDQDVVIVAGAPGTIVGKTDGNFDRSCAIGSGTWNSVYVQHADGSVAWYGHMKSGSPTAKAIGETVATGEYLGTVGSSGSSTGPHLHVELYDASNALVDPWLGACNSKSKQVTWASQRPYRDPGVNALTIGTAAPVFPACPTDETPNAADNIAPGTTTYFTAYLRDQVLGQALSIRILRPDNSVYWAPAPGVASQDFNWVYWYWYSTIPASEPAGTWKFEVTFASQVSTRTFVIGGAPNYGAPTAFAIQAGSSQAAAPSAVFAGPVSVKVTDAQGRPVPKAKVIFTLPTSGATAIMDSPTALTDANGLASVGLRANNTAGSYNATVSVTGVAPTQSIPLFNVVNAGGDNDGDGIPNGVEAVVGRNAAVKDNDVFGNATLFAMQQYRDFLSREGDPGGTAFWSGQVSGGFLSRAQVIEDFFSSQEFQGTVAPVARLYFAYFLRVPDYAGLNFWIGYFRAGNSLQSISDQFAASAEFQNRYGALDNGQFVNLIYQNVLGRAPDAGGFAFWKGRLDGALATRGEVMLGFSESDEYRGTSNSEVYVTMAYMGMLRRAPDTGGFNFWVQYMDGGSSGLALLNGFLGSAEYRNRFLP